MRTSHDIANGILMDHSPCLADEVPLDGLVDDIAKAITTERERCARIADEWAKADESRAVRTAYKLLAHAIRSPQSP